MEQGLIGRSAERLASAMRPLPTSSYGYPVRRAYPSEQAFFMRNPNVGGYAAEDNSIVLNEGSPLSNRELGMVAQNEAARLYMRNNQIVPEFPLTQEQQESFQGTPYASSPEALKQSIAARIITGDPSAGKTTKEQRDFSQRLLKQMRGNSDPVAAKPETQGIIGRLAKKLEQSLGVPRPWELSPLASMGYQMATGEGSLGERARKGAVQSLGRYVTNMANPSLAFDLPQYGEDYQLSDIIQDKASWMRPDYYADDLIIPDDEMVSGNEVLSRELFDLPPRIPIEESGLVKTGPKQYEIKRDSPMMPFARESGLYYNPLLGKYNVAQNPATGTLEYSDVWDISSPVGPAKVKVPYGYEDAPDYGQEYSPLSHMMRELVNPYLRPATVRGKIP